MIIKQFYKMEIFHQITIQIKQDHNNKIVINIAIYQLIIYHRNNMLLFSLTVLGHFLSINMSIFPIQMIVYLYIHFNINLIIPLIHKMIL